MIENEGGREGERKEGRKKEGEKENRKTSKVKVSKMGFCYLVSIGKEVLYFLSKVAAFLFVLEKCGL